MDEHFARARIALGSLYKDLDEESEARNQFTLALESGDRLGIQDKLLAEAWLSAYSWNWCNWAKAARTTAGGCI